MSKLTTSDGRTLPGFLAAPTGEGGPAVIVIHEWWGLNDQTKGTARRLAADGFQAFAPDLYQGKTTKDAGEAGRLKQALDPTRVLGELHHAVQALLAPSAGRVGVIGFCMGGAYALATAATNPEVKACVPFYGIPTPKVADVARIRGAVLGHYANRDGFVSPDRVDALEQSLAAAGVKAEIHRYDADHAFANEQRPEVYAPAAAQLAWQRTLAFLHRTLELAR